MSGPQHTVRLGADQAISHAVEIGEDLVAQVQKAHTETASKAAGEASKSLDDMKKSLPK